MIPKHAQFIAAMHEKKKVCVRFYSKPDSGVLDRTCAPMDYAPARESKYGLNRYWLWDYLGDAGSHTLGLGPQQIVDLQVLGEGFDPTQLTRGTLPVLIAPTDGLPPATIVLSGNTIAPIL